MTTATIIDRDRAAAEGMKFRMKPPGPNGQTSRDYTGHGAESISLCGSFNLGDFGIEFDHLCRNLTGVLVIGQ